MRSLVLLVLLITTPVFAGTADEDRSRALFLEGNTLLAAQQWSAALERYDAAWALFPRPSMLINRAAALAGLGRSAEAANAYAEYLSHPGATAEHLPAVRAALAQLDARLGRLEITVGEPGAVVILDGHELGPQRITRVAPGRHEVAAREPGFTPALALVTVSAGERRAVILELVPEPIDLPLSLIPPPAIVRRTSTPGPLAAQLRLELDVRGFPGGAAVAGLAVSVGRVELGGGAILGLTAGAEASVAVHFGALWIGAGLPVYFTGDGPVIGVAARAGVRWRIGPRMALDAGVAVQRHFDPKVVSWLVLPSVAWQVRL